ncbi:class I SAM-dependent methyltransferase [Glutamicibacter nicotianae]|nr:class I SAM-dependent methyltransferase [Glutamicibacter nicotianae]WIV45667.1 class I SAM-dependent methyltransferase [Glutamicibacter nicotianae]
MAGTNYDDFAQAYSDENESSLLNAYYERPATLKMAGEVAGRRILDIGCGSGPLAHELMERGARVSGFDASQAMIDLARARLGEDADLRVADLGETLPYEDNSFDDAIASLVLHYLEDWTGPLSEIRRVLAPGGRFILSLNHPILYPWNHPGEDYFQRVQYTDELSFAGKDASLTYWHRPLHETMNALLDAGFSIQKVWEPPYSKDAPEEIIPDRLRERDAFLSFIFFELRSGK